MNEDVSNSNQVNRVGQRAIYRSSLFRFFFLVRQACRSSVRMCVFRTKREREKDPLLLPVAPRLTPLAINNAIAISLIGLPRVSCLCLAAFANLLKSISAPAQRLPMKWPSISAHYNIGLKFHRPDTGK